MKGASFLTLPHLLCAVLLCTSAPLSAQNAYYLEQVEFRALPLEQALRLLSQQTGMRIVASQQAQQVPVTLFLEGVSGPEVLQALCTTHGLWMTGRPGADIVRIYTAEEYARDAGAFRREETDVFTLKYPNARDVTLAIRDLYGPRVVLARRVDDSQESGQFEVDEINRRLQRFDLIDSRSEGGFGQFDTPRGRGSFTDRGSSFQRRTGDRIRRAEGVRDRREASFDALDGLTPEEILALESGTDTEREAALDLLLQQRADIFVTVIDRLNKVMVRTRDETTMREIRALVQSLDVATPLVLLEVRILAVDLERGLDTAFEFAWIDPQAGIAARIAPGGPVSNPNLLFSVLDDRFRGAIELLQSKGKVTALGRPTLLTANNEVSRLFIGEEVPLNRSFGASETIVTASGPIVVPGTTDIEFRPVGTTLLITPNINEDRTVMLRILQEESKVVRNGADVLVPDGNGGFVKRDLDVGASHETPSTRRNVRASVIDSTAGSPRRGGTWSPEHPCRTMGTPPSARAIFSRRYPGQSAEIRRSVG